MKVLDDEQFLQENFSEIMPSKYAESLKIKFQNNPDLWYNVIIPKNKADDLREKTRNDYSEIWHEHCSNCYISIDKNTQGVCYASMDKLTWLCKDCYDEIFKKNE